MDFRRLAQDRCGLKSEIISLSRLWANRNRKESMRRMIYWHKPLFPRPNFFPNKAEKWNDVRGASFSLSLSLAFILGTLFFSYVLNLVFNQIIIILLGMIYTLLNTVFSLRPPQLLHSKRDEFEKLINSFDLECLKSWWFCGGSKTSPKFAKICGESENDLFGFFCVVCLFFACIVL